MTPYTAARLKRLQAMHKATGNPVFVWWAIHFCLNEGSRVPLPEWCLEYLGDAASNMNALSGGRDFRKPVDKPAESESRNVTDPAVKTRHNRIQWRRMSELIPAALGFAAKGKNILQAAQVVVIKARGASHNKLLREVAGATTAEAVEAVAAQFGISAGDGGSAVRAICREGERLSRGERVKPRG
jgi:hypothetical protein